MVNCLVFARHCFRCFCFGMRKENHCQKSEFRGKGSGFALILEFCVENLFEGSVVVSLKTDAQSKVGIFILQKG